MLDNFNLLAIGVSSINPIEDNSSAEFKVKILWAIILVAIIVVSVLLSKYLPSVMSSIKAKKAKSIDNKKKKERDSELERLHRIKEKNKRK